MQTRHRALVLILSTALVASLPFFSCTREKGERAEVPTEVKWLSSIDDALAQAGEKNLPMMIDFYTEWCGYCKQLDRHTYVDAQVVRASADFVNLKIDAEKNRPVADKYNIKVFPTIVFTDRRGREIHRVVGYKPPQMFVADMNAALRANEVTGG